MNNRVSIVSKRASQVIRLGYVRLLDAAPLIIAEYKGLFSEAELNVELSREVGWATIRDKLAFGGLDMAHALSPMPLAMGLGAGVAKTPVITGLVMSCNGNAITLSRNLSDEGVSGGLSLKQYIKTGSGLRKLVFGIVSLYSSHHFILCRWLEKYGLKPHKDVIITVIPPELMVRNLASGNIDGFCVGEPWNSLAIEQGIGWCPATSAEISSGYPEKVLATTEGYETYNPEVFSRMIEVITKACAYCEAEDNHQEIVEVLSMPRYLDCSPEILKRAFSRSFPNGNGDYLEGDFIKFHGRGVNRPDLKRAKKILSDLIRYTPDIGARTVTESRLKEVFRTQIYDHAISHAVV